MVQWGPSDYAMHVGRTGQGRSPEIKAVERKVLETALEMGVPLRVALGSLGQAQSYLDMGVRHFCMRTDITILHDWWKTNGRRMRQVLTES